MGPCKASAAARPMASVVFCRMVKGTEECVEYQVIAYCLAMEQSGLKERSGPKWFIYRWQNVHAVFKMMSLKFFKKTLFLDVLGVLGHRDSLVHCQLSGGSFGNPVLSVVRTSITMLRMAPTVLCYPYRLTIAMNHRWV